YGGYYHGTTAGAYGYQHTGYYGTTTTPYGAYYHQPATVNYYGGTCYGCGTGAWGAAAAGATVGMATGVAVGAAATAAARPLYPVGATYAVLPGGCVYSGAYREYNCGGIWFLPSYGANGVNYQVVPAP